MGRGWLSQPLALQCRQGSRGEGGGRRTGGVSAEAEIRAQQRKTATNRKASCRMKQMLLLFAYCSGVMWPCMSPWSIVLTLTTGAPQQLARGTLISESGAATLQKNCITQQCSWFRRHRFWLGKTLYERQTSRQVHALACTTIIPQLSKVAAQTYDTCLH